MHVWYLTPDAPRSSHRVSPGDRLTVRTNCPGVLTWWLDDGESQVADTSAPLSARMVPAGSVMAGVKRYHLTLGPFPPEAREAHFTFRCTHPGCDCRDVCCDPQGQEFAVRIE